MDTNISILIGIMGASGLLGGYINYLLESKDSPQSALLVRSMVIGIGASFLVPLFLNMISSSLIVPTDPAKTIAADKFLVFAGFCLIAAISSSAFIRTLSDRILKEVQEAKKEVQEAKQAALAVKDEIVPLTEKSDLAQVIPMMYQHLYQPNGFKQTIQIGEQYVAEKGEPNNASFWTNLAAGYGQLNRKASQSNDAQSAGQAREKALQAVKRALAADEKKAKPWLQFIWDPTYPGKNLEDNENDLEQFFDDEEFKKLLV